MKAEQQHTRLRPLFVTTQDTGGAGIAALRLLDALQANGVDAAMLTYDRQSGRGDVKNLLNQTSGIEKIWLRGVMHYSRYRSAAYWDSHHAMWSSNLLPNPLHHILNQTSADLLHLHWIGSGLMPISSLPKLKKPLVWTLHDMWAFTGGCHYSGTCHRYETHCGGCPLLGAKTEHDLSYRVFEQKQQWHTDNLTPVTPSRWLADCVRHSALLGDKPIEVIPNPIDTTFYQPLNRQFARQALHLPQDKKLLLFGSGNIHTPEKGFDILQQALTQLSDEVEQILFGDGSDKVQEVVPIHVMGMVKDARLLTLLYNAADVFVAPSREDNLPNMVMEALSCGTPCVAFNIGGMPDLIDHQQNGYLAQPFEPDDLAAGVRWILHQPAETLAAHARAKVLTHYHMDVVAKQYIDLYRRILDNGVGT